jgi:hypothetical protein
MCFTCQTIATFFSQVMAAVGANTAGPGMIFSEDFFTASVNSSIQKTNVGIYHLEIGVG